MSRYRVNRAMTLAGLLLLCTGAGAQTRWDSTPQRSYYRAQQPSSDRLFARKIAQGNLAEIRLGRLAIRESKSSEVREFARMMVNDHRAALRELRSLAARHDFALPSEVTSDQKATYERLADLHGEEFDRAYMNVMVREHWAALREVRSKAKSDRDSDFQDWATKNLDTFEHHLEMARETHRTIAGR